MFEARQFLKEQFANPQKVLSLFAFYGLSAPTLSAVEKWFSRGSIPGDAFPVLIAILELERGAPVSVTKYLGGERG